MRIRGFVSSLPDTGLDGMKKKKKHQTSFEVAKNLQRKLAIQQGFYDGRFKEKMVKDKKKERSRKLARKKVDLRKEE